MTSSFSPAWWLRGAHRQTFWGKFFRRLDVHDTRIERLETPDGDFLDLHHLDAPPGAPILVLLHGLEGSVRSHYIQGLLSKAKKRGWRAAVLIFRSCGGESNRTRRSYHSGETTDIAFALNHLESAFPHVPIVLAGVSLGGNVLLKFLGEQGSSISRRIKAAAAVSVPYDLARSSRHIDEGFARVYQWNFLRSLRRKAQAKLEKFPDLVSRDALERATTMFAFDDCFTAPVHGFENARDYYAKSSSINWLETISINTLLLSAVDDPFLPSQVLDQARDRAANNPHLIVEFPPHGGHVGFVGGRNPLSPTYYLEERVSEFLAHELEHSS
ncbi:MAG TPA: hydrolase [Gemmatimonadaceae bacterium]|nr:hydrolase [Gemmatimonadaceae bacterium]